MVKIKPEINENREAEIPGARTKKKTHWSGVSGDKPSGTEFRKYFIPGILTLKVHYFLNNQYQ